MASVYSATSPGPLARRTRSPPVFWEPTSSGSTLCCGAAYSQEYCPLLLWVFNAICDKVELQPFYIRDPCFVRRVEFVDFPVHRHRSVSFSPRHQPCSTLVAKYVVLPVRGHQCCALDFLLNNHFLNILQLPLIYNNRRHTKTETEK